MSSKSINCPICNENSEMLETGSEIRAIRCPICGEFDIEYTHGNFPELTEKDRAILKTYYYKTKPKQPEEKRRPALTMENKTSFVKNIVSPSTLNEKINYVIKYIADNTIFFHDIVPIDRKHGHRLFFCKDEDELNQILNDIAERGYITENSIRISVFDTMGEQTPPRPIVMTSDGLKYAETLQNRIDSQQCFVAMWFNEKTTPILQKIEKAITGNPDADKTSSEYGANYKMMRIDQKEHNDYIPSEIISEIKRSRFMIADLTGYRGGVYYEAGYAEGLGIPVILTCNENWLEEKKDENGNIIQNGVHFDLKQKNILFWNDDNLEQFQRNLVARIGEIVGFYQ